MNALKRIFGGKNGGGGGGGGGNQQQQQATSDLQQMLDDAPRSASGAKAVGSLAAEQVKMVEDAAYEKHVIENLHCDSLDDVDESQTFSCSVVAAERMADGVKHRVECRIESGTYEESEKEETVVFEVQFGSAISLEEIERTLVTDDE